MSSIQADRPASANSASARPPQQVGKGLPPWLLWRRRLAPTAHCPSQPPICLPPPQACWLAVQHQNSQTATLAWVSVRTPLPVDCRQKYSSEPRVRRSTGPSVQTADLASP